MAPTPLQNRKYLCQAPRPEVWGELSETVLSNLGASAVHQLTDTVQTIRALHDMQPRTGPGRKSNAEHALQFYEYLLQLATTAAAVGAATATSATATSSQQEADQGATSTAIVTGIAIEINEDTKETAATNLLIENNSNNNDVEDDSLHDAESVSIDTPTFNAQHNDVCEVCDEAGELLMCSTCNLVFHLECVRPKMDVMPEDRQWRCSHCVLQSNQKKNSKARRQAAAAVRLMARLRKQHEWRRLNASNDTVTISATDTDTLDDPETIVRTTSGSRSEEAVVAPQPSGDTTSISAVESMKDVEQNEATTLSTSVDPTSQDKIQSELPASDDVPESTPTSDCHTPPSPPPLASPPLAAPPLAAPPLPEPVVVKRKVGRPPKKKKLPPSEIAVVTSGANQPPAANVELRSSPARRAETVALEQKTPIVDSPTLDGDDTKQAASTSVVGVEAKPSQDEALDAEAVVVLGSKKRVAAESLDVEASTTPCSEVSSPDGRSKRCRKQPTLYDPQRGPASRWQTDELKEWKASRVDEIDTDDKEIPGVTDNANTSLNVATTPAVANVPADEQGHPRSSRKLAQEMGDGVWCSFCKDKLDIPICVFCACRVCFGKHNQTQLLLCDLCDEEYHTFCLDPPLTSVPDVTQWFCPSCRDTTLAEAPRSGRRAVVERVSVRSKSREPIVTKPVEVAPTTRPTRTPPVSPRKAPTTPITQVEVKKAVTEKRPVGRPRGRPPKNPPFVAQAVTVSKKRDRSPSKVARSASEPPRKRGRPPSVATVAKRIKAEAEARKSAKLAAKANSKTNSSQLKKTADTVTFQITSKATTTVLESVSDPVLPVVVVAPSAVPVTISRSGRMVRRSSFHDERLEGAQHLKSGRSPSESILVQGLSDGMTAASTIPVTTDAATTFGQVGRDQGAMVDEFDDANVQSLPQTMIQPSDANTTLQSLKQPSLSSSQHDASFLPIGTGETSSIASRPDSTTAMSESDAGVGMFASSNEFSHSSSYRDNKQPRRKPGARECMQISRRFGVKEIPQHYIDTLNDYCTRGKVEHLIRMRERLDEHSRFLESQLAGLEAQVLEHGESDIVVPLAPPSPDRRHE